MNISWQLNIEPQDLETAKVLQNFRSNNALSNIERNGNRTRMLFIIFWSPHALHRSMDLCNFMSGLLCIHDSKISLAYKIISSGIWRMTRFNFPINFPKLDKLLEKETEYWNLFVYIELIVEYKWESIYIWRTSASLF